MRRTLDLIIKIFRSPSVTWIVGGRCWKNLLICRKYTQTKLTLMFDEILSDGESVISENEEEIIEDIVENNKTTEAIAQEINLSDDNLEFGSDIDDNPDDLEDKNTIYPFSELEKTRNCSKTQQFAATNRSRFGSLISSLHCNNSAAMANRR
ncbi:hypothetical protein FQA39_LY03781 [Lamprigera yunnana]|nr:hypothetical protein FQA39_LY03781 [Lamprigera yunnana]